MRAGKEPLRRIGCSLPSAPAPARERSEHSERAVQRADISFLVGLSRDERPGYEKTAE